MSIEDLQADLAANMAEAKGLSALSTIGDVVKHLNGTLWPFLENVVGELDEIDGAMEDMYLQQSDVLRFETGKQLMSTIVGAQALVADLKARAANEPAVLQAIAEWEKNAQESAQVIQEITLPEGATTEDPDDEDDDEDDEDDDEGDEGDDEDAEDKKGTEK